MTFSKHRIRKTSCSPNHFFPWQSSNVTSWSNFTLLLSFFSLLSKVILFWWASVSVQLRTCESGPPCRQRIFVSFFVKGVQSILFNTVSCSLCLWSVLPGHKAEPAGGLLCYACSQVGHDEGKGSWNNFHISAADWWTHLSRWNEGWMAAECLMFQNTGLKWSLGEMAHLGCE